MSQTIRISNTFVTAAGSFSPETSTAQVSGTGTQWEAMPATQWEQNTFLCRAGFTCLTERQWALFHLYFSLLFAGNPVLRVN